MEVGHEHCWRWARRLQPWRLILYWLLWPAGRGGLQAVGSRQSVRPVRGLCVLGCLLTGATWHGTLTGTIHVFSENYLKLWFRRRNEFQRVARWFLGLSQLPLQGRPSLMIVSFSFYLMKACQRYFLKVPVFLYSRAVCPFRAVDSCFFACMRLLWWSSFIISTKFVHFLYISQRTNQCLLSI